MMNLVTARGYVITINWIGISDYDDSLRFEAQSWDIEKMCQIFCKPAHTKKLTRVIDDDKKVYEYYTDLKGIEKTKDGIVIRLNPKRPIEEIFR